MSIDYTAYSSEGFTAPSEAEIVEPLTVEEEFVEFESTELEDRSETAEEDTVDEKVLMGTIDNCNRVYVRSNADKDSEPVTDLNKGAEVLVTGTFDDSDNVGWYKVCTATGVEGYIMSKFVKLAD